MNDNRASTTCPTCPVWPALLCEAPVPFAVYPEWREGTGPVTARQPGRRQGANASPRKGTMRLHDEQAARPSLRGLIEQPLRAPRAIFCHTHDLDDVLVIAPQA